MKRVFQSCATALLLVAGCVALSPEERRLLSRLEERGYDVDSPPPGFDAPVDVLAAAGLNALPGVGNFYLGCNGGGALQWVAGTANLLLWPISPCWAVAEGGWDARTMNKRALLDFCREKARKGEKLPLRASSGRIAAKADGKSGAARAVADVPKTAPYEITTEEPFSKGRAVYLVSITDSSMTAFDVVRAVRPEIEKILRDACAAEMPGMEEQHIRACVVPEFGEGRSIRFRGWAFAMRPVADGWNYNPETRKGTARFRISGGMPTEEAKRWARENIEAIVKEKNVSLEPGKGLPEGVTYRSLGESLENGVLTVEFEVVE